MAHSPLAKVSVPADPSNYTKGRQSKINKITAHHMAGVNSAEGCGRLFANPARNGSSHYGIGNDGTIGVYVEEENTAWTDGGKNSVGGWASNNQSVTIEVSNSATGGDWPVSDAAFNSLVELCADVSKRNNLGALVVGQNLTWHSMYAATACPGPYLLSKMQELADRANKIITGSDTPVPAPAPQPAEGGLKVGDKVTPKSYVDYNGTRLLKTRDFYFIQSVSGNRAVLAADNANGPIYAAMKTDNLNKIGEGGEKTAPQGGIAVGSVVTLKDWVDYRGARLLKTRDSYFVSEIAGNRAVLRADSMNGPVYAAVNTANLILK